MKEAGHRGDERHRSQDPSPGFPVPPHEHTFLENQTLDRSHVAGANSGRFTLHATNHPATRRERIGWRLACLRGSGPFRNRIQDTFHFAAVERGKSAIGSRAVFIGKKFPPSSKAVLTLLLPFFDPTLYSSETHVHW